MTTNQIVRVIQVLKVNNRNVNQRFYEETLGMKVLVEEGALLSLGDASKVEKIVLEESPSMRSRKVEGPKKLGRIVVKVAQAQEIDYLLARQPETSALYQELMVVPLKLCLLKEIPFSCMLKKILKA